MKKILFTIIASIAILDACTYVTVIHTQGRAKDLIDETDSISPTVTATVPITPGGI